MSDQPTANIEDTDVWHDAPEQTEPDSFWARLWARLRRKKASVSPNTEETK